ncbi:MAG: hypothetical protein GY719_41450 [bacterium]|nr:hypothetical protein [bacterium]
MWFLGLLLLVAAAGLLWGHRSQQRKHGLIVSTKVQTVEHLRQLAASMAEGLGAGSLRFFAAVEGKVRCAEPLTSELAEVAAVHYSMDVRREAEEPREERGSGHAKGGSTRRASEQVAHSRHSVAFEVEDATGSLRVDPAGAKFHTEKSLSRFEPTGGEARRLQVGSVDVELPARSGGDGSQTLGYRFEEEVVPVGAEVFVLGQVTDPGGELRIGSPEERGRFVISVKSRTELLQELGSGSKFMRGAAIVLGVAGVLLLLFG